VVTINKPLALILSWLNSNSNYCPGQGSFKSTVQTFTDLRNSCVHGNLTQSQILRQSEIRIQMIILYVYINGNPVKIQTLTHWKLIGRSVTAPRPVLSPSSILPQSSPPFCCSSRKKKFEARFKIVILAFCSSLTLILLTWRIWWAPNNASKWQMRINSAFKWLNIR